MIRLANKKDIYSIHEYIQGYPANSISDTLITLKDKVIDLKKFSSLERILAKSNIGEEVWYEDNFGYVFTIGVSNKDLPIEIKLLCNYYKSSVLKQILDNICFKNPGREFIISINKNGDYRRLIGFNKFYFYKSLESKILLKKVDK